MNSERELDWVSEDQPPRTQPYTEEELDLLVDGFIKGMEDTTAWQRLVREKGEKEARAILRSAFLSMGPSCLNQRPCPN